MLGLVGTIGVIAQMAVMALGYDVKFAMACGLVACVAWLGHAIKQHDGWLFATNAIVGIFALGGLT